jgi:putative ABC transport system permease protein
MKKIILSPRWRKVLSDLWSNKLRSVLVIASISVGLFAVGAITTMSAILENDMRAGYEALVPANIRITTQGFDVELINTIRRRAGVRDVSGSRQVDLRVNVGESTWKTMTVRALSNMQPVRVDKLLLKEGVWPPGDKQIVVDQYKFKELNAKLGDWIEIRLPSDHVRQLQLVGMIQDQTIGSSSIGGGFFMAPIQGYVNLDTLEWLGQPADYNQLNIALWGNTEDEKYILSVNQTLIDEVESSGRIVYSSVLRRSNEHPNVIYVDAVSVVLMVLGLLVVFLSAFLITNTISALLNQQIRQVGIMKTLGASSRQITGMYLVLLVAFGLLALVVSIPLGNNYSRQVLAFLSKEINFSLSNFRIIPQSLALQGAIALLMPLLAGFVPIYQGSRMSIREAIAGNTAYAPASQSLVDRLLRIFTWLTRPTLISLRNTFRRRLRLVITLLALSLAGAIFIATFNVRLSVAQYIERLTHYFLADVNLTLARPYPVGQVLQSIAVVPGVTMSEAWGGARCELVLEDGSIGDTVQMTAPPVNSPLVSPILQAGRWLEPGDQNAIVVNERFLYRYPSLKPGDTIKLRISGDEKPWVVVGIFQFIGNSGGYIAYTSNEYLSTINHQYNQAAFYRVVGNKPKMSLAEQEDFGLLVEAALEKSGYKLSEVRAGRSSIEAAAQGLNILTIFLFIMAALTAVVGAIGLMGTMTMNVLERTREIGIMRAIGADSRSIMQIVIGEGLVIGFMSWVLASILAIPISRIMADMVSQALFQAPADFTWTPSGFVAWLGLVLVLSVLASFVPARNAAHLTIREVLAYE